MSKKMYKIFPDYCSSGIWDGITGVEVELPEYIPQELKLLLKYWHGIWEMWMSEVDGKWNCSESYFNSWDDDGRYLVLKLNELGVDVYEYRGTEIYE